MTQLLQHSSGLIDMRKYKTPKGCLLNAAGARDHCEYYVYDLL